MTPIPAGTAVPYTVTYLEMTQRPVFSAPALPADVRLDHAQQPPVWFFLALYDAVGRDYEWRDKFEESEGAIAGFIRHPDVQLWTANRNGWPQGFFQLDFRVPGTCDLAYFGVVPQAVGEGLGGLLLRTALTKGWGGAGVTRMTVNTCTLDHPRALTLYQRMGFVPLRTEDRTRILHRDRDPARIPA